MAARVLSESALRVSDCVTELLRKQPFFGSLVLRLPLRPDPTRETLATDGHEIRYSPRWIAETEAHLIETAMARVVMACALKHHTRRGKRDRERWQMASQLVTHALIRDAGFTLPPDAEAWDDLSVEQAYDRLPTPEDGDSGDDGNASSGAAGAGGVDAQSSPDGDDDGTRDPSDSPDHGDGQDSSGSEEGDAEADGGDAQKPHDPGGGEDGQGEEGASDAPPSHDPSGTGEVMDADARAGDDGDSAETPVDVTAEEQAWDEAMHQALNIARAEGKVPGQIEETVKGAHASQLDWRTLLRRYMTDAAKSDYSWSLPNRRFIDFGLYLPSIRSEGMETIAVIVDTSGSLPAETLGEFWAELREVAAEIKPESVVVLQVDAGVQDAAEYTPDDLPDEIVVKGRGGTDFRPGFEWLDEQGIQPAVCLYFTDMECSRYPDDEPVFDVVWVNWSDPPEDWNREPWGERIDIAA
ncbi:MAG: VWA-like domain-containing protein [Rhodospirillales bacterium]|nr:VWA-like domain-containing protein [Rhodospirillales bacterium]MDE0377605.1 VWA-like domain-containing protein [Rhodospirillales bacterium]